MSNGLDVHKVTLDEGPWRVTVHVDLADGIPRCVGLDIRGFVGETGDKTDPPRPLTGGQIREVTATGLRSVKAGTLLARACDALGEVITASTETSLDRTEQALAALGLRSRRYDLAHYEEVARVYSESVADDPVQAVVEHFHPLLSRTAAKKHVAKCRELGLLGPTRPGRPGGAQLHFRDEDTARLVEEETVTKVDR